MKKIAYIKEIEPEESLCITVDSDRKLFRAGGEYYNPGKSVSEMADAVGAMATEETLETKHAYENTYNAKKEVLTGEGLDTGSAFVTHNSVLQRNIVFACILRPQSWSFVGVDLKKVELTPYIRYSNVVLGIATTLENAVEVLRFAQQTMMKRYEMMTQLEVKNFLDLPEKGRALLVMVDEYAEAASPTGSKTDEGKEDDAMKGEIQMIVGSIARLGRAAGVHMAVATQRPDAKLLSGETKDIDVKTPILTTEGFKNMGDLKLGDKVFDEQGKQTSVVNMTDYIDENKVYKVNFKNGVDSIIAGHSHRWPIRVNNTYKENVLDESNVRNFKDRELLAALSVKESALLTKTMCTLRDFENTVNKGEAIYSLRELIKNGHILALKNIEIENSQYTMAYFDSQTLIDKTRESILEKPDKGSEDSHVIMTTEEIFESMKSNKEKKYSLDVTKPLEAKEKSLPIDPYLLGLWLRDGSPYDDTFYITDLDVIDEIESLGYKVTKSEVDGVCEVDNFTFCLRSAGISSKDIPADYLTSSAGQRKELLLGILGKKGFAGKKELFFTEDSESLIDKVLFLARSLGYTGYKSDYKTAQGKHLWRVDINTSKEEGLHYIESIELVETVPTKCIEVDNDSHTYLAGKGLVPTHNSNLGCRIACGYTNPTASSMVLDNTHGTRIKSEPRGRLYLQIYNKGNHGQGFFAGEDWMDKYLESQGLKSDGTPLNSNEEVKRGEEAANLQLSEAKTSKTSRPEEDWDDELDSLIEENQS